MENHILRPILDKKIKCKYRDGCLEINYSQVLDYPFSEYF